MLQFREVVLPFSGSPKPTHRFGLAEQLAYLGSVPDNSVAVSLQKQKERERETEGKLC